MGSAGLGVMRALGRACTEPTFWAFFGAFAGLFLAIFLRALGSCLVCLMDEPALRRISVDWIRLYESQSSRHSHRRIYRHSESNVKKKMTFCSNQFVQTETMFLRVSFLQSRKQATISGPELMTLSCPVLRQTNWLTKISSIESFSKTCIKNNNKFKFIILV